MLFGRYGQSPDSQPEARPEVPVELDHFLDVPEIYDAAVNGQNDSLRQVKDDMDNPYLTQVLEVPVGSVNANNSDESIGFVRLPGNRSSHKIDRSVGAVAFGLPYGQGWKPSMYIRARKLQQIAAPENDLLIFPATNDFIRLSDSELREMDETKSLDVIAEKRARALEALGYDEYKLTGASMDGLVQLGVLAVNPEVDITAVNIDEMPYGDGSITTRFLLSGGSLDQRAAIRDSKIEALKSALNPARQAADYGAFALLSMSKKGKAEKKAMSKDALGGQLDRTIAKALENARFEIPIKFGKSTESLVFDQGDLMHSHKDGYSLKYYSGKAARKHAVIENPVAHALMAWDGFQEAFSKRILDKK